jgi:hypothetical protein
MDAFIGRSGHCATVASARREGQNAAESFIRAIPGDHARSILGNGRRKVASAEGGKQAAAHLMQNQLAAAYGPASLSRSMAAEATTGARVAAADRDSAIVYDRTERRFEFE